MTRTAAAMRLRSLLLDNLSWKLLSLGLALLIWYGARLFMHDDIRPIVRPLQPLASRDFQNVPVRLLSHGRNTAAVRLEPASVLIRVGGDLQLIEHLTDEDPLVFVELPSDPLNAPIVERVEVRLPPSIRLLSVVPERVTITPVYPP